MGFVLPRITFLDPTLQKSYNPPMPETPFSDDSRDESSDFSASDSQNPGSSRAGKHRRGKKPFQLWRRPELKVQSTTLWEYPSQHYGLGMQGHKDYKGATPSWVIWQLLQRYTRENDKVVDPMCGSGTTLDVCRDLKRQGMGFDIAPFREDIQQSDARKLPLTNQSVDFFFMDPPYSTHIEYSGHPDCIGELDAGGTEYYQAMEKTIQEAFRVLKNRRYFAIYVSDSFKKGKPFNAIGFELFAIARKQFKPVDIIAVVRNNRTLKRNNWHNAAVEGNFFLRGFNYVLIFKKEHP
jgi:DNA modification methylase